MTEAFGTFNPNFYGVSLIHAGREAIDRLAAYDGADDLARWIETAASQQIEHVGLISTIDHEIRHFHDFLLSPFGLNLMGLRIQATVNGFLAITALGDAPGKYLPAPLSRWMEWDQARRQEWIDGTGRGFGIEDLAAFVPIAGPEQGDLDHAPGIGSVQPLAEAERLAAWSAAAVSAFRGIGGMRKKQDFGGGLPSLSPDDVFEASAHLVQAQAVWQGQGAAASQAYMHHLETANLAYLDSYNMLRRALQEAEAELSFVQLAKLYCWMMLTPPGDVKRFGNPAFRLMLVLAAAKKQPRALLQDLPPEALWDYLDAASGSPPWRANLEAAAGAAARRKAQYAALRQGLSGNYHDALFETFDLWLEDRQRLGAAFTADPKAYVDPFRYLNESSGSLPLPFLLISFGKLAHRRAQPLGASRMRAIAIDEQQRDVIAYVASLDRGRPASSIDHIVTATMLSAYVDYCFFEEGADNVLDVILKAGLEEIVGKEVVHVY